MLNWIFEKLIKYLTIDYQIGLGTSITIAHAMYPYSLKALQWYQGHIGNIVVWKISNVKNKQIIFPS
jgi:hypothetical protein